MKEVWAIDSAYVKFWTSLFDASSEQLDVVLGWLWFLGLSSHMCYPQSFVNLGNSLGKFLDADYSI